MGIRKIETARITIPPDRMIQFCEKWKVQELALFGSVLRRDFTEASDIDILVSFFPNARHSLFEMVRMQDELTAILGRRVDLVERAAVENSPNYIRRKHIMNSRTVLYVA